MNTDQGHTVDESNDFILKEIVEKALKDFSDQQINLKSKAAREAITIRIVSDIKARQHKSSPSVQNANKDFERLQRKLY